MIFLFFFNILFEDSFEYGMDNNGNFINWDETSLYGGIGDAFAFDDTLIRYDGRHAGCFQLTEGEQGGWAYVSKVIQWPETKRLYYSFYLRNGNISESNVIIGGLYFIEAYIVHPSGYRERANIETHPSYGLPDTLFMIRMAYRGRDGQRHRQQDNLKYIRRGEWYNITMLVDLSGEYPFYAWWLDGDFVWSEYDSSTGNDTLSPTEVHFGCSWLDWYPGNKGKVWIDKCVVSDDFSGIKEIIKIPSIYTNLDMNGFLDLKLIIPIGATYEVSLYDIKGRKMDIICKSLYNCKVVEEFRYNLNNYNSGIYFVYLKTKDYFLSRKIVFFK